MNWPNVAEIVKALAWPVTTVLLAWFLRHDVRAAFGRVEKAKLPGGTELSFGKTSADQPSADRPLRMTSSAEDADWQKTANVYWLGHDIMWTIDVVLRGAPRSTIVHGLSQALHHLREVGLADRAYGDLLKRLRDRAEQSLEPEWTPTLRDQFAGQLRRLSDQIGALAESQQPEYSPGPAFS